MAIEEVKVIAAVPAGSVMMDYGTSLGYVDDMAMFDTMGMEDTPSTGINTELVLYIVIGVCAVLGIVLGIIMGKRAANK